MNITSRINQGISVFALNGRFTAGSTNALRTAVTSALNSGARKILINMNGVDMMDSSGLGELVRSKSSIRAKGGTLKLSNVSRRVISVFELTGATSSFEMYDDEIDAVRAF